MVRRGKVERDTFNWDLARGVFATLAGLFVIALLYSFLSYCWATKEYKQFYLVDGHGNSSGLYCIYQNVENDADQRAYCSTNPIETMQVYKFLKEQEIAEANTKLVTGGK